MGAEMTATMIVWPRPCGHGGTVLELVEHFRPYWYGRRAGRRVASNIPAPGMALVTGLAFAAPTAPAYSDSHGAAMAGRRVTLLRYPGCILGDDEIAQARREGVHIEVVDVDGDARSERSGR